MAHSPLLLLLPLFFLLCIDCHLQGEAEEEHSYIVHASISDKPAVYLTHHHWYVSTLATLKGLSIDQEDFHQRNGLIYTYGNVFHGFTATLTESQAAALISMPGFVSTFLDRPRSLHTTRTPEFLGLTSPYGGAMWDVHDYGQDVIVGVLDTGVWPERRSFNDHMLGPIPKRWKGVCEFDTGNTSSSACNRKLIGARAFFKGYEKASGAINETREFKSPRDSDGHGTHTSSTAAGSYAYRASLFGYAKGTARGMAPRARLAMYKVCWQSGCFNSDILSAIDTAVADGVDVISMSIGGDLEPYYSDPIAVATFGAMERGVITCASAGNSGPDPYSVGNVAPWILTVAASTVDRDFPAVVTLGNSAEIQGVSLYSGKALAGFLPLIYSGDAALLTSNRTNASLCYSHSLDPKLVAGKIILCDRGISARTAKSVAVREAGGAGMILANSIQNGEELAADSYQIPATIVGYKAGLSIKSYMNSTSSPKASITFKGTVLGVRPAPVMAAFSSRGPNMLNPEILKPDITAPGVNILAAWSGVAGPTGQDGDNRVVDFNIMSGTSMSCPHVGGLTALVKARHPRWSPSAVKSALMTTATTEDNTGGQLVDGASSNQSNPFVHGAGHVNLPPAIDPGLVYDTTPADYFGFLCGLNYTAQQLAPFAKGKQKCSLNDGQSRPMRAGDLNYPSFSIVYKQHNYSRQAYSGSLRRWVTNVGAARSMYKARISAPRGVQVSVHPPLLNFTRANQRLSYLLRFDAPPCRGLLAKQAFGSLDWSDGLHHVRSPIAFLWT